MDINELGALEPLERDVSAREYFRGNNSILMSYPDINDDNRAELLEFIRIGAWLSDNGIKVPELYDLDEAKCMARFEDLGRVSFGSLLRENPNKQKALYILATDLLKKLAVIGAPENLPAYNDSNIHKGRTQIIDYYFPVAKTLSSRTHVRDLKISPFNVRDDMAGYLNAWQEIENSLPPCPKGFIHGDYHLENLMYVDGSCALIDYQDALYGALPYDLVNLLEDARVDIPATLRKDMIDRYCADMSAYDKDIFLKWYRVLGTQFHCRVLGLFIKLSAEQGRDDYLIHTPRLQNYISSALNNPLLLPLKSWFEKQGVDFVPIKDLNGAMVRARIMTL